MLLKLDLPFELVPFWSEEKNPLELEFDDEDERDWYDDDVVVLPFTSLVEGAI